MVEAAGVELFNPLILRKLLVLQEATNAKKASLPGRRYKNGTKSGRPSLNEPLHFAHRPRAAYRRLEQMQMFFLGSKTPMWLRFTIGVDVTGHMDTAIQNIAAEF